MVAQTLGSVQHRRVPARKRKEGRVLAGDGEDPSEEEAGSPISPQAAAAAARDQKRCHQSYNRRQRGIAEEFSCKMSMNK